MLIAARGGSAVSKRSLVERRGQGKGMAAERWGEEGAPGRGTGAGAVCRTTAREGIVAAKAGGKVMDNIGNEQQ